MTTSADLDIRLRRATFNRALAAGDLGTIASILAPNVVLVAGTDSALISGRKAQLAAWKREFAASERITYVRATSEIIVSPVAPLAFERGAWRGVAANEAAETNGIYTAKWRQFGAEWMIEAELYLTLT